MRKLIFFLLIFSMFCSTAAAFIDTVETYPSNNYTDYWVFTDETIYNGGKGLGTGSVILTTDPRGNDNQVLHFHTTSTKNSPYYSTGGASLTSKYPITQNYFAFTLINGTSIGTNGGFYIQLYKNNTSTLLATLSLKLPINNSKYEIIRTSATSYSLYENGTMIQTVTTADTNYYDYITIKLYLQGNPSGTYIAPNVYTCDFYIDDITDSSAVGTKQYFTEVQTKVPLTWSAQLMREYPAHYSIDIYSISNATNAGLIKSYSLPNDDSTTFTEHGFLVYDRAALLGSYFGLYNVQLRKDNIIIAEQYFYMDQVASQGRFPDVCFSATTDVKSEIRDENNEGGIISGGETVYLLPDKKENGVYNITHSILESPYSITTEYSNIFNTTITGINIHYTGLSNQQYIISVDGAETGSTTGADTLDIHFDTFTNSHIISFAPDYTKAGVWGEVKNSETQEGIKSATVSVSGDNFSKTLYTDDNGLFYLTKGLEAGKTYIISVSKTGYSAPPSQTAVTVEGSTTRQDFYLDKLSTTGSGLYYAPHDVAFTVREYWYSGAGLTGVPYAIYNGTESLKTGSTDSKGMFTGSDMTGGTNYTITLTYGGKTYTEYVEPSLSEYTLILNKEGILHQYANPWLSLSYTENSQNVTIAYESNKTITGASLTATAGNGTIVYSQTLNTTTGSFLFETGGEGDYTLNFHIQATDGSTASQSWGLSYPDSIPLFPDSYPAWLKNILFSGIVMVFLLAFGKSKNDIACGAVAILTSMGYMFGWFTGSYYFVVLVWIIALGAVFLHYKRTGGIG